MDDSARVSCAELLGGDSGVQVTDLPYPSYRNRPQLANASDGHVIDKHLGSLRSAATAQEIWPQLLYDLEGVCAGGVPQLVCGEYLSWGADTTRLRTRWSSITRRFGSVCATGKGHEREQWNR